MNWNLDKIEAAKKVLAKSSSVKKAAKKLNTTPGALRKAFKRYSLPSPASFLKSQSDDERSFILDSVNELYIFKKEDEEFPLTFEEVEQICVGYCNKPDGLGKTAGDVADTLGVPVGKIEIAIASMGLTHKSFPVAPHQVLENSDSLVRAIRQQREASLKEYKYQKGIKSYVAELEDEVRAFRESIKIVDDLFMPDTLQMQAPSVQISDNVLFIFFTDAHAGKLVLNDSELLGPKRKQIEYNSKVFKKRLANLCAYIQHVAEIYGHMVDNIQLFNLGDSCEALLANMREHQGLEQYNYLEEQAREVKFMNTSVIETVRQSFAEGVPIDFYKIGGNHDRLTKDKGAHSESLATYLFVDALRERYRGYPNLTIHAAPAIMSVLYPNKLNLIGQHGHYAKWESRAQIQSAVYNHGYPEAERYLLVQGHRHTFDVVSEGNMRRLIVSAIVGADQFTSDQLGLPIEPPGFHCVLSGKHSDLVIGPFNLDYDEL